MICNTSTLNDHILTNVRDNIPQFGVINTAIPDHDMIYYTRKIPTAKYNKYKELAFCSLRSYSVDVYEQFLERVSFRIIQNLNS